MNCWVALTRTDCAAGVTAIETSAGLAVRFVCVLMLPELTVIIAVPGATPLARPALFTVMTDVSEEAHVTELVRFPVVWSE